MPSGPELLFVGIFLFLFFIFIFFKIIFHFQWLVCLNYLFLLSSVLVGYMFLGNCPFLQDCGCFTYIHLRLHNHSCKIFRFDVAKSRMPLALTSPKWELLNVSYPDVNFQLFVTQSNPLYKDSFSIAWYLVSGNLWKQYLLNTNSMPILV